ncbi:zinc finger CCCH domain-containing protein 65-like [Iris pallida]|uniref:Zinc finger CCCH domain-containing protein 65-like n=1 Tax=Iris pallida TaxID=29817 RepID=A0AAX6F8M6_IRIPA|nr:zinc finger CCCH domain-containing protein 65-like [Iris pallida]
MAVCPLGLPLDSPIADAETLNPLVEHETLNDEIETLKTLNDEIETLNDEIETINLSDGSEEPEESAEPSEKVPEGDEERSGRLPYPLRPGEPDCDHYVRTGGCRYGAGCRFNHPPDKIKAKVKVKKSAEPGQGVEEKEEETSSEMGAQTESKMAAKEKKKATSSKSNGKLECKYYLTPGGCKNGKECKYVHHEKNEEVPVELNFLGLPIRPGMKECDYYMRTGGCKYSTNCRNHHPDPTAVSRQDPHSRYQNGGSQQHALPAQMPMTSWPLQGTPSEPVTYLNARPSFFPGYYLPPHPNMQWNSYQAPINTSYATGPHMQHPSNMKDNRKAGAPVTKKAQTSEYPEKPGQPECPFFMKTGSCKFKGACKFHHPKSRLPKTPIVNLNPVGLPLRPDQSVCTNYSRHGICKYGRSCRYHHPMDSRPSGSPIAVTTGQNGFRDNSVQPQVEAKTESSSNSFKEESEW